VIISIMVLPKTHGNSIVEENETRKFTNTICKTFTLVATKNISIMEVCFLTINNLKLSNLWNCLNWTQSSPIPSISGVINTFPKQRNRSKLWIFSTEDVMSL